MSNLAFTFENTSLSILGDILNPLFIAQQVCSILGYKLARKAVADHCDPEDVCKVEMQTNGGRQLVNCVNESGLYALIFGSKLPKAKQFKRWVTNEVLPAIRKQGCYSAQEQDNTLISNELQCALSDSLTSLYLRTYKNKAKFYVPTGEELKTIQEAVTFFLPVMEEIVKDSPKLIIKFWNKTKNLMTRPDGAYNGVKVSSYE